MGADRYTLLDIAKMEDPDGAPAQVAEVLHESNPMFQEAPAFAANAPMGNRVTRRSSIPTPTWTQVNKGYTKAKSSTEQLVDTIGILELVHEFDTKLKKISGGSKYEAARRSNSLAFAEGFAQEVESTLISGDESTEPSAFTGLQKRLETLSTTFGDSIVKAHHSSPTGSDYTSIYVVDWGERGAHLIYPENSVAGLEVMDKGELLVDDADGNKMFADTTQFLMMVGLTVIDHRHIARLCNIDVSQALADTDEQNFLYNSLAEMLNLMPAPMGNRRSLYCTRNIYTAFERQMLSKSNVFLSWQEYLGEHTLFFKGYPLRISDQISEAESLVS